MNRKIRPSQLLVLLVLGAAPDLLMGQGTLPGLLLVVLLLCFTPFLLLLPHRPRTAPAPFRYLLWGILSLFFLWEAARTAAGLGRFAAATEQEPFTAPLLASVLLLTAAWGAAQGAEGAARAAGLWLMMGLLLLLPVWGMLLPAVSASHLRVQWTSHSGTLLRDGLSRLTGFGGELVLLWLLTPHTPSLRPRHGLLLPLGVMALGLPCLVLAAGVLGGWASVRSEPLYTALLALRPDGAFRPDSLYTVVRIAAHYSRAALFLLGFYECLRQIPRKKLRRFGVLAGTAGAVCGGALLTLHPELASVLVRLCRGPALALGAGLPLLAGRRTPL